MFHQSSPFVLSSLNLPLPFHSSMTHFLSLLFFCVLWSPSPHYMWSNAPVSQSGCTCVHISSTHSLCAGAPNQYCALSHWRPQTHTHKCTSTHYGKWGVPMPQACDKSSSQFHSICHHSQLPSDAEYWPWCLQSHNCDFYKLLEPEVIKIRKLSPCPWIASTPHSLSLSVILSEYLIIKRWFALSYCAAFFHRMGQLWCKMFSASCSKIYNK